MPKALLVLNYLDTPTLDFRENNIFELVYQGLILIVTFFWMFLDGTTSDCVPQIGILMSWSCKMVQLWLFVCRFSNWCISKAIGFKSSNKISMEKFLVKFGFFATLTENIAVRLHFLFDCAGFLCFPLNCIPCRLQLIRMRVDVMLCSCLSIIRILALFACSNKWIGRTIAVVLLSYLLATSNLVVIHDWRFELSAWQTCSALT